MTNFHGQGFKTKIIILIHSFGEFFHKRNVAISERLFAHQVKFTELSLFDRLRWNFTYLRRTLSRLIYFDFDKFFSWLISNFSLIVFCKFWLSFWKQKIRKFLCRWRLQEARWFKCPNCFKYSIPPILKNRRKFIQLRHAFFYEHDWTSLTKIPPNCGNFAV